MRAYIKRSQPPAAIISRKADAALCVTSAEGEACEQKDAEAWGGQQTVLEHSSEKSCQEHVRPSSAATQEGSAAKGHLGGTSSQGSEASHRREWREQGEHKWESGSHSLEISSSQGGTSKAAAVEAEEADASSVGPGDTHSAASLRQQQGWLVADAVELPVILGNSAVDKATHARALADMAWADARKKAKRAAGLLAAAQHAGAEERRPAKRQRQQGLRGYVGPPEHILLGARISVFWPDDDAFYKGRIVEVKGSADEARVIYDDDMEEWLSLTRERFQWLAPRAQSAGGTPELQVEMAQLGAEGVLDTPNIPDLSGRQPEQAPGAEAAIGGRVTIHFAGVGVWCSGEVLAYDAAKQMHHVLYEDGENEWICLPEEAHAWMPALPGQSYPAGLAPGLAVPCKKQAIGWRVAVYWREDSTLYEGEIIAFDNITLRHHIRYDSGDHEHVLLDAVKVCWIMPPSVSASASGKEAASTPSSPGQTASGSACHGGTSSSGNGPCKLKPVAELSEGDIDEESAQREAEAFSEALVPEHAPHAQPALWWSQSAAGKSAPSVVLVPDLPARRAGCHEPLGSMMGQPWIPPLGTGALVRGGGLQSARLSLPDCCGLGGNAAPKERSDAMLAFSRSLSMPDAPFDDLMTELGGPYEDETPLSAGLDTLDMQLPSMELTPDMQDMLIETHEAPDAPLLIASAHGSGSFSSDLHNRLPGAQSHVKVAMEDFLRPEEEVLKHESAMGEPAFDTSSCQRGSALGAGRMSSKSLASDSTAVRFQRPLQPLAQHAVLASPAMSATATPESQHQIPGWEMRQHCSTPTPAQALGLTPLPDHGNPTDALEASMALHSRAECADELAMPTELQCLIAEMNWDP